MQKTRLGISVGLLGAALFLSCLFGSFMVAVILAGYILLFEENAWLKKSAVKGVALLFGFALLSAIVHLIPNAIDLIDSIARVFDGYVHVEFISDIIRVIDNVLNIAEKILFIVLGFKALNQGTIKIPVIDSLVNKYMA